MRSSGLVCPLLLLQSLGAVSEQNLIALTDAQSREVFKSGLDGALGNLI